MTQAVLEGVAFALRDSLEVAKSLGIHLERTKICGGGAKSPLWKKMIANILNLKVDVIESEEGPAMGGAMLAAVACGEYASVEEIAEKFVKVTGTVERIRNWWQNMKTAIRNSARSIRHADRCLRSIK